MKLNYLSCHSILEYDELGLFSELGIDCFSMGAYTNPEGPGDKKRPPIGGMKYDDRLVSIAIRYSKDFLPKELVEPFDIIYIMHTPEWVTNNWELIRNKMVIWRSIGQSVESIEKTMYKLSRQGLKIVRYSPAETSIPSYAGHDAIIRFHKDPNEFKDWNGQNKQVITVAQSMSHPTRIRELNYNLFLEVTKELPVKLYGIGNEDSGEINGGILTYEELLAAYRDNRVFFYTGTKPASYTLGFIEAWMTGIPVVAIGPELAYDTFHKQRTYEVHKLIESGVTGYWSDSVADLRSYIKKLLDNPDLGKKIGEAGRRRAIELFGKQTIKKQWGNFFGM